MTKRRKVSIFVKLKHNILNVTTYTSVGLLATCILAWIVLFIVNLDMLNTYCMWIYVPAGVFLLTAALSATIKYLFAGRVVCVICKKRFKEKQFHETEGKCTYCGSTYFMWIRYKTEYAYDSGYGSTSRTVENKYRHKGEDLLKLLGSGVKTG